MKPFQIIFFIGIILILLFPLINTNLENNSFSSLENRYLSPMPETFQEWIGKGENFIKDRIGFRREMVLLYNTAHFRVFGEIEHNLWMSGKDGHLFYKEGDNNPAREYSDDFVENIFFKLSSLHKQVQSQNIPFLYIGIPDKLEIYPEYLSESYKNSKKNPITPRFNALLENSNIPHILGKELLQESRKIQDTHAKAYDTAHYNAWGGFVLHKAIARELQKIIPQYPLLDEKDFRFSRKKFSLTEFGVFGEEELPVIEPININFSLTNSSEPELFSVKSYNPQAPIKKKLLLIGDSYMFRVTANYPMESAIFYYGNQFQEVYFAHNLKIKEVQQCIDALQPDFLLYEVASFKLYEETLFQ